MMASTKGLKERLRDGENIICAEGYLIELERRGYVQSGGFFPVVTLDHPDVIKQLHEEYVHAGSDVVEAFTFYAHREKMRVIGREDDMEKLNRKALEIASEVARAHGKLLAGNICNTGLYVADNPKTHEQITEIFKEQITWAVEAGVDFIIAETYNDFGEAMLALEAVKQYGNGLPAVVTLAPFWPEVTMDGLSFPEACLKLEEAGAAVVGLNCGRGPKGTMDILKEVRKVCKGPIAALPVPFRTKPDMRTWHSLRDPDTGKYTYPLDLECHQCKRSEIREFAKEARELGVQYIGLCCGSISTYTREIAEVYGRKPPASAYSPDLSKSMFYGKTATEYKGLDKFRVHSLGETI